MLSCFKNKKSYNKLIIKINNKNNSKSNVKKIKQNEFSESSSNEFSESISNEFSESSSNDKKDNISLEMKIPINYELNKVNKKLFLADKLELYDENNRFLLKSVNNYDKYVYNSLPLEGWIKPCHDKDCSLQTSRFIIINNISKYYFCHECLKNRDFLNFFKNIKVYKIETNSLSLYKGLKL